MKAHASQKRAWFAYAAAATLATVAATGAIGAAEAGCTTQPILEPLRSLERSGAISYICLDTPLSEQGIVKPVTDCTGFAAPDQQTFSEDDAGFILGPHLYAMVTQTSRGEIAVVDMTTQIDPVIDENPNIPGANFLPIGADPIDIVSTPGSTATFVGVAETGREGIFALPSTIVRPSDLLQDGGVSPETPRPVPTLSSWPACSLPSAPGAMLLINDPPNASGAERARCDQTFGQLPPAGDNGDLNGPSEPKGRPKIVVAMPDMGGIAVIDAQTLLDRPVGSFEACPLDLFFKLDVRLPKTSNPPPHPPEKACVWPADQGPNYAASYTPRPSGMSYVDGTLYVADLQAPVIHIIDFTAGGTQSATPCDPVETSPLLPRALTGADLTRVVVTKKVSVGPLTTDLKRFAYAIDEEDASMMVFDLTGPSPYPIDRTHPEWDPLSPRDRVRLPSPVADVLVAQHDAAQPLPTTGVAPEGALCDPNPAVSCLTGAAKCDIGAVYRTVPTYDLGAGPLKLRGQFAFAALTNGHVGVVDIEDYDAPCRIPAGVPNGTQVGAEFALVPLAGCSPPYPNYPLPTKVQPDAVLQSADEISCNVVLPNQPRDQVYTSPQTDAGFHQPSLQTLPVLYDLNGSEIMGSGAPRMFGTIPNTSTVGNVLPLGAVSVASTVFPDCTSPVVSCVDPTIGVSFDEQGEAQNTIFMNLEDPRAQLADQSWTVTFEGQIPGFSEHLATVQFKGEPSDGLRDPDARFCDSGVQSEKAVDELLKAYRTRDAEEEALDFADYVQIFTDLPLETDAFWDRPGAACDFSVCNSTFGTITTPTAFRDLPIIEAYQDHLDLLLETHAKVHEPGKANAHRQPIDPNLLACCFPPPVAYNVRVGGQWLTVGSSVGYLHHIIADPTTGVCRNSCDPLLARLNGRVYPTPPSDATVTDVDPNNPFADGSIYAFINPMFRFAISGAAARDDVFEFSTSGSFQPLLVVLAPDATTLMAPVAVSVVPPLGELLAVVDGGHQGITTVDISSATVSRHFF